MATRSKAVTNRIIKEGIPPAARGLLAIDFDATLVPWGELVGDKPLLEGAKDAVDAFREAGYRIVILTSRLSPTWWDAEGFTEAERQEQVKYVHDMLDKHGIVYEYITCEKIPCTYFIDDRAIEFKNNWAEIAKRILG